MEPCTFPGVQAWQKAGSVPISTCMMPNPWYAPSWKSPLMLRMLVSRLAMESRNSKEKFSWAADWVKYGIQPLTLACSNWFCKSAEVQLLIVVFFLYQDSARNGRGGQESEALARNACGG